MGEEKNENENKISKNLRQIKYYYRKNNGKPRFKILSFLAEKELGMRLPSARELLSLLLQKCGKERLADRLGISAMGMWKLEKKLKNEEEPNLSFETYKTLLRVAVKEGILKKKVNLDAILKEILQKKR